MAKTRKDNKGRVLRKGETQRKYDKMYMYTYTDPFTQERKHIYSKDLVKLREKEQALHMAIQQLTPRQQEIVRMIYFEGKTQEEVALLYGVDGSAIRHAMKRVYARLKKFLEKN